MTAGSPEGTKQQVTDGGQLAWQPVVELEEQLVARSSGFC
jgi:hypothetical protein